MRTRDKILIELAEAVDYGSYFSSLYNKRSHDVFGLYMGKKDRKVEQAIRRLLSVGEIEKEVSRDGDVRYKITSLGLNTLSRTVSLNKIAQKPWDKKWRFVVFDIEEKKRSIRDTIRDHLYRLGLGPLQKSVWISPHSVLDEIEKLFISEKIESGVLFFEAEKVGSYSNEEIAKKAWDLSGVSESYAILIENHKKEVDENPGQARENYIDGYLEILKGDPCLPNEVLPSNWQGREARKLFDKIKKTSSIRPAAHP